MRGNDFLDKMELIDPAYVEAADDKPKRKKRQRATWGALAACFAIMVLAGTGILQDYGDVVVHLFDKEARAFYDLDRLWEDAKVVDLSQVLQPGE